MEEFLLGYITYLDLADYLFLGYVLLFITFGIYNSIVDNEISLIIGPLIIILAIAYYNYIPLGIYKAHFSKINGKVIGEGIEVEQSFEFDLDQKYLTIEYQDGLPLIKEKSDFYTSIYGNNNTYVSITLMGTVKLHRFSKESTIEVDY